MFNLWWFILREWDSSISQFHLVSLLSISLLKLSLILLLNCLNHLCHLNCLLHLICLHYLNCMHHLNCLHCLHHVLNLCWFIFRKQVSQVILCQILLSKKISLKINQKISCNHQHSNNQMMLMFITVLTSLADKMILFRKSVNLTAWSRSIFMKKHLLLIA